MTDSLLDSQKPIFIRAKCQYSSLSKGKALIDPSGGTLMATTIMGYIAAKGSVAPQVGGRIVARRE